MEENAHPQSFQLVSSSTDHNVKAKYRQTRTTFIVTYANSKPQAENTRPCLNVYVLLRQSLVIKTRT